MNGTVIQSEITLFQVGKQFDALVVDTSAPVFDSKIILRRTTGGTL